MAIPLSTRLLRLRLMTASGKLQRSVGRHCECPQRAVLDGRSGRLMQGYRTASDGGKWDVPAASPSRLGFAYDCNKEKYHDEGQF